jgi:hypothetical protein
MKENPLIFEGVKNVTNELCEEVDSSDDRIAAVAAVLAIGVLRLRGCNRRSATSEQRGAEDLQEMSRNCLELLSGTVLSVTRGLTARENSVTRRI